MPASDLHGPSETIRGPKTGDLPPSGAAPSPEELPYSGESRPVALWLGAAVAAVVVIAAIAVLAFNQSGTDDQATAPRPAETQPAPAEEEPVTSAPAAPTVPASAPSPTSAAPAPTTAAPAPTTVAPAPPPTAAPVPPPTTIPPPRPAPVPLPPGPPEPHRAIFGGGKLFLVGTVPDRATSDAFFTKAAEVIGADNVINNYVIDPRAPEATDGRVIVAEEFVFPTGSAEINPSYSNILELGVIVMQLNPEVVMEIVGHTDSVGDDAANQRLSEERANAVVNYFVFRGIDRSRFRPSGRGETQPAASNATPEGQAQNRRIEVQLFNLI